MLFPKFTEGLEAVLFIALNSGSDPVSSKEICNSHGMLPRHLEPTLQVLVKAGILKGTKGPKGGYSLAREKRKIVLSEIFVALCAENLQKANSNNVEYSIIKQKITSHINDEILNNIRHLLQGHTIEDLCKKVENKAKKEGKAEFNI